MKIRNLLLVEASLVTLIVGLIFLSIPLNQGGIGLSWDALNHQIYLGWVASAERFSLDLFAAASQSYQYPYLYWPLWVAAEAGWGGVSAGIFLAMIHVAAVPPVWIVAYSFIPGVNPYTTLFRCAAVAMAFMSALPLKTLESTGNDLMAAMPFLWGVAIVCRIAASAVPGRRLFLPIATGVAGALIGLSLALKLSNAPIAVAVPIFLLMVSGPWHQRLRLLLCFSLWCVVSFISFYGWWGMMLWDQFRNPIFPLYDPIFIGYLGPSLEIL